MHDAHCAGGLRTARSSYDSCHNIVSATPAPESAEVITTTRSAHAADAARKYADDRRRPVRAPVRSSVIGPGEYADDNKYQLIISRILWSQTS